MLLSVLWEIDTPLVYDKNIIDFLKFNIQSIVTIGINPFIATTIARIDNVKIYRSLWYVL